MRGPFAARIKKGSATESKSNFVISNTGACKFWLLAEIDGMIAQEGVASEDLLQPVAIAETYYQLHRQASSAWTHELDLRPWVEKF